MKLTGLKPTHIDLYTGIKYAKRGDSWYFLQDSYGICSGELDWGESNDYTTSDVRYLHHLIEIES